MKGRILSHYQIDDEISRGGMGVVYRAVDVNLGREVAIKVLPEDLGRDPDRRQRLLQEARAASALEHPHIAVIHEVGEAEGISFIAMELIRGEKLSDILSRGPLPIVRALGFATEIAEGLARAHDKGVVHRDLKPANVMVTDDGHVKVIDFGLAKLVDQVSQDAATASVKTPRTDAGVILGTAAYMSPEQARGGRVDHRSDIFALGVTLYEMVTGRPAFQGQSSLDTMQAILTQPVPPLPALAGSTGDATAELQRIIGKSTVKDPDERYQGMKDLIVDLRAARRRLESTSGAAVAATTSAAPVRTPRSMMIPAAVTAALIVCAGGAWWWMGRQSLPPPVSPSGKPSLAVLHFENNTGDASLDWMRTGLTDMLVTDLSQSPDFEVIGTDRLMEILKELRRADDAVLTADLVREIANRARVDNVLVGSYVKAGNTIRITARLQEPHTGRVLGGGESVEGPGEGSLFSLVDELTRRFKTKLASTSPGPRHGILKKPSDVPLEQGLDRGVTEITTASIEAYRYYAEGHSFHERGMPVQAAPLLERAIEIDPTFAMAYAKLAVVHNNLVSFDKRDEFAKRALALTDRLTTRERFYIEGFYYTLRPATVAKGIAAYQQGLQLHPEHQASRHNLGLQFIFLEQYQDAIVQYEEMLRRGTSNPTSYENRAEALVMTGNPARALEVANDYVQRYPDSASGRAMLGRFLAATGRLDEADAAYEQAQALDPVDFLAPLGRRFVALLGSRWDQVARGDEALARLSMPFARFQSLLGAAFVAGAQGRGRVLLEKLDEAVRVPGLSAAQRANGRSRIAQVLLRQKNYAGALGQLQLAMLDARGREPEFAVLHLMAVAQTGLGMVNEAEKTLQTLDERARAFPSQREVRRVHWARGEMALVRKETSNAVAELNRAAGMLPLHGQVLLPSTHAELWYSAAVANIAAGGDAQAAPLLERLQAGHERVFGMEVWGRSFYLLGGIYERRGDPNRAREQHARFVELWGDGDMERGWVSEARQKLAGSQ